MEKKGQSFHASFALCLSNDETARTFSKLWTWADHYQSQFQNQKVNCASC